MGKKDEAQKATDDKITRRMCCACWVPKATDTQNTQHLLLLHGSNGYTNVPKCYLY